MITIEQCKDEIAMKHRLSKWIYLPHIIQLSLMDRVVELYAQYKVNELKKPSVIKSVCECTPQPNNWKVDENGITCRRCGKSMKQVNISSNEASFPKRQCEHCGMTDGIHKADCSFMSKI